MTVQRISSASPYEPRFGYCRALRVGSVVHVAGTAPIGPDGKSFAPGDVAAQTRRCFQVASEALEALGADLSHVVRTRMFLTDIEDWEAVGAVHGEVFGNHPPVATMLAVARLIDPDWKIEVELEALLPQ